MMISPKTVIESILLRNNLSPHTLRSIVHYQYLRKRLYHVETFLSDELCKAVHHTSLKDEVYFRLSARIADPSECLRSTHAPFDGTSKVQMRYFWKK